MKQLKIKQKKLPPRSFSHKSGTVFLGHTLQFACMDKNKNQRTDDAAGKHENPLPNEISKEQHKLNVSAHDEAEKDMEKDAEFTASSPNDDLDEGESARLGEKTDLI